MKLGLYGGQHTTAKVPQLFQPPAIDSYARAPEAEV